MAYPSAIGLAVFALVIALLALYGVLQPLRLVTFVRGFMAGGSGLLIAVVGRLVLAALLWLSAPLSLTPTVFKVLTFLALLAAFALPILGTQRILSLMGWVEGWGPSAIRLACLIGVAFGGFLLWSVSPVFAAFS
jgi:hypothetical protein